MKAKLLILSAFLALACISCGHDEMYEGVSDSENSSAVEISEIVNAPKNVDEINTVDEEMTEKGNTPAYEVHVKEYKKDGECKEYTEIKNCFDAKLLSGRYEYEYKYNSDGLTLEEKHTVTTDDNSTEVLYSYKYDEYSNMIEANAVTSSTYDNKKTKDKSRCENEYDDSGRLIRINTLGAFKKVIAVTELKYDENGNISEMTIDNLDTKKTGLVMNDIRTVYEYDDSGNTIKQLETVINDGKERRGTDVYTTYNSRNLPETEEKFKNDELFKRYEYEYEFYNE